MAAAQRVTRRRTVPAPLERVWRAMLAGGWLGTTTGQLRHGGDDVSVSLEGGGVRRARVALVEAPNRLVFWWWPVGQHAVPADGPSLVEVALEAIAAGTLVTVTETAVDRLPGDGGADRQPVPPLALVGAPR